VPAVEAGTLVVLAAGKEAAVERARPVLQALGEVRHVGELSSAAVLKLVANSMLAGVTALAAELQSAGTAAGLRGFLGHQPHRNVLEHAQSRPGRAPL
jgi:3-hydroxyisobutyrate dehydrogenase-like beta-hydroxyacid dehydrogenase